MKKFESYQPSILIIEDDHDIRVALRQLLEDAGYFVHSVANALDALQLLEKMQPPQLIILDMAMPLMNGFEFLKKRESLPSLRQIPVLVISAHDDLLKLVKELPHLKKPLDLEELVKLVPHCIS